MTAVNFNNLHDVSKENTDLLLDSVVCEDLWCSVVLLGLLKVFFTIHELAQLVSYAKISLVTGKISRQFFVIGISCSQHNVFMCADVIHGISTYISQTR